MRFGLGGSSRRGGLVPMSKITYTLEEQIAAKNLRLMWLGNKELEYALAIQRLLCEQSRVYDEIVVLEVALAKEKSR
jgi:hypothetical protein